MGMELGPMILQPAIGWVLDSRWDGLSENGIRLYDLNAYHVAFTAMIGLSLLGTLLIPFAKETYCQQLQEWNNTVKRDNDHLAINSHIVLHIQMCGIKRYFKIQIFETIPADFL